MSGQLHFELDASVKLFTELTTLAASLVRAPTDDVTALAAKGSGTRTQAPPWRALISPAVHSFSSCIDCYQRQEDTSSPLPGD